MRGWIILLWAATLLLAGGCTRKPLAVLGADELPLFSDDQHYAHLEQAITRSLSYLESRPPLEQVTIGDQSYPLRHLIRSLQFFQRSIAGQPSSETLTATIRTHFDVLQATGRSGFNPGRAMLGTGYYQPVFSGSLTPQGAYRYPLYGIPDDLALRHNRHREDRTIGRLEAGKFLPYWTRREIETQGKAQGHELVWLQSPLDAFFLHVQGSGLIKLPDGTYRGIHYALGNGRPYSSIGKYMVKTGRISLKSASMATISAYLSHHPEEQDEILHHNDSFIFFTLDHSHAAIGNLGQELTPGRSVAVDQTIFPAGVLSYLASQQPLLARGEITGWKPLHRFVLAQDSGSAIRGPGRVDLFWGRGDEAGIAAGSMKEAGQLYVLLLKEQFLTHSEQKP